MRAQAWEVLTPELRIDREAGVVEFDAEVVFERREVRGEDGELLYVFGDWLELVVCGRNTREHESLLATGVRASELHASLLLLGLEPGRPATLVRDESVAGGWRVDPPTGPEIAVTIAVGNQAEVTAGSWVKNKETGEDFAEATWLFTGSKQVEVPAEEGRGGWHYLADLSGSLITLVNFRDDLMALPTTLTSGDDGQVLGGVSERIPATGTAVRVRLRAAEDVAE
ncbi:YdjY domain-containing protein [Mucisphaera calidilacus]|uniref:YdjY domain-containing protein n=1 Tax=Mucisphaera calidilacus TaxID=2527982 RepID=UPI0011A6AE74|nr:YdjY domain-containing protein [Mucisphaera calidilacus]